MTTQLGEKVQQLADALLTVAAQAEANPSETTAILAFELLPHNPTATGRVMAIGDDLRHARLLDTWTAEDISDRFSADFEMSVEQAAMWRVTYRERAEVFRNEARAKAMTLAHAELVG